MTSVLVNSVICVLVSCYQNTLVFLLTVYVYLFDCLLGFFKQVFVQFFLFVCWCFLVLSTENLNTNKHNYKYNNT